jgi:hypothetical protein
MRRPVAVTALAAVTAALAVTGLPASGQEAPEVRPGDRVRVTLASRVAPAPLVGNVLAMTPDTLVVEREEGGVLRVTSRQVDRIDVSIERRHKTFGEAAGAGLRVASPLLALLAVAGVAAGGGEIAGSYVAAVVLGVAAASAFGGAWLFGTTAEDVWVEATLPTLGAPSDTLRPRPTLADTTGR